MFTHHHHHHQYLDAVAEAEAGLACTRRDSADTASTTAASVESSSSTSSSVSSISTSSASDASLTLALTPRVLLKCKRRLTPAKTPSQDNSQTLSVQRRRRRRRRCLIIWVLVALFTCFMLTVGVHLIAELAVERMYASQLDIRDYHWDAIQVGPIQGQLISLSVTGRAGGYVPLTVRVPGPISIWTSYAPLSSNGSRQVIGEAVMTNGELVLSAAKDSPPVQLNLSLSVQEVPVFSELLYHLLSDPRDHMGPAVIGVDVWLPRVDVMWGSVVLWSIMDLTVNKTALLRDPADEERSPEEALGSVDSVRQAFTLLSRILTGKAVPYINQYITMDSLALNDPVLASLNESAAMVAAPESQQPDKVLPFSIMIHFWNPTAIHLVDVGLFMLQLAFNGTMVANITVPSLSLQPFSTSSVRIYGNLCNAAGQENVLQHDLPSAVVQVMSSQRYRPLPVTIGAVAMNISSNMSDAMLLNSATQSVLSRFSVPIGKLYNQILPTSPVGNFTTLSSRNDFDGINELFSNLPVLGKNRLGDSLQGLRLRVGWGVFTGKIGVNIFLANPFGCTVSVNDLEMRVYASTDPGRVGGEKEFLGWLRLDSDNNATYPLVMPPFSTLDGRPIIGCPFGNASLMTASTIESSSPVTELSGYPWPSQVNSSQLSSSIVHRALQDRPPQLQFQIAASSLSPTSWASLYDFFDRTLQTYKFRVSLAVDRLDLSICGFDWDVRDLGLSVLEDVPIVPPSVVDSVSWPGLVKMVLGEGWAMVAPGSNAFNDTANT